MPAKLDIIGKTYGRLTVLSEAITNNHRLRVLCACTCGNTLVVQRGHLYSGHTSSCGCLHKEVASCLGILNPPTRLSHGATETPEYRAWCHMKERCLNPAYPRYADWGGRGITVCPEWINSFETFLADMGLKPAASYSIDREDNNGSYCKENCRWATPKQQSNNRRVRTKK